jgi:hypothetical protein
MIIKTELTNFIKNLQKKLKYKLSKSKSLKPLLDTRKITRSFDFEKVELNLAVCSCKQGLNNLNYSLINAEMNQKLMIDGQKSSCIC